jgi:hypothetical protein
MLLIAQIKKFESKTRNYITKPFGIGGDRRQRKALKMNLGHKSKHNILKVHEAKTLQI